jgi:hypothetical protein
MNARLIVLLCIAFSIMPCICRAVTSDNFQVRTTEDLVSLCDSPATDPLHKEAINFCEGFMIGALSFHDAEHPDQGPGSLVCMPNPGPTRDGAARMFVQWAKAHAQYMSEKPVDTLFRFGQATWPCKR